MGRLEIEFLSQLLIGIFWRIFLSSNVANVIGCGLTRSDGLCSSDHYLAIISASLPFLPASLSVRMTNASLSGGNVTPRTIVGIVRMSRRIAVSELLGGDLGGRIPYHNFR